MPRIQGGVFACIVFAASPTAAQTLPHGVAAGDVDQTSAVLWARSTAVGPALFEYSLQPDFTLTAPVEAEIVDPQVPVKVEINVRAGETYYYRFTDPSGCVGVGHFHTPFADGSHGLRFGVSGDWRGELRPYVSISNAPDRDLDFFVALGDTIYADVPSLDFTEAQAETLDDFRVKHTEVYSERFGLNLLADLRASTATYACIDDHEVTNDFAGGAPAGSDPRFDDRGDFLNESELFTVGLQAFHEYNPIREETYADTGDPRMDGKPKLYRYRRFGSDAAILMFDARSFRDEELPSVESPFDYAGIRAFKEATFDPSRTMLGRAQFEQFEADLLEANDAGITWKFVLTPEPIQNLGPVLAGDRYEGYAFERSALLRFIRENAIDNVVFITADIHGTVVNNLVYQEEPGGRSIPTTAFEISTGSVAYAAPLGPTAVEAVSGGLLGRWFAAYYDRLRRNGQDALMLLAGNTALRTWGYPAIGLARSLIDAQLLFGRYLAVNTFGWTEFEIDAETQRLKVTTYGIPWYTPQDMADRSDEFQSLVPQIVSQFQVDPRAPSPPPEPDPVRPTSALCGALSGVTLVGLSLGPALVALRRRRRYA